VKRAGRADDAQFTRIICLQEADTQRRRQVISDGVVHSTAASVVMTTRQHPQHLEEANDCLIRRDSLRFKQQPIRHLFSARLLRKNLARRLCCNTLPAGRRRIF